ncbi:MAG TPA: ABC transporter substrate-binding protein, partial [Alphaproteobacteria bacterium]|nr:ABC transporter substrate-binding protein [Alphaproteobacteria bacterium]
MSLTRKFILAAAALAASTPLWLAAPALAQAGEVPFLADQVAAGKLPPMAERLPKAPAVVPMDWAWQKPGQYGGDLPFLMARAKDTRMVVVYSYARLVNYTPQLEIAPDILE